MSAEIFTTREEIRDSLVAAGVSAGRASQLAAMAKPCVWLETFSVVDERDIPLGATKIGGRPDLPRQMSWPSRPAYPDAQKRIAEISRTNDRLRVSMEEDRAANIEYAASPEQVEELAKAQTDRAALTAEPRPLSFIAQINLTDLARTGGLDGDVPISGRLLFFFDAEQQFWGFGDDAAGWSLLYDTADASELRRENPPHQLMESAERVVFAPLRCVEHRGMSSVALWGYDYPITSTDDPDHDPFSEWYFDPQNPAAGPTWDDHRIGGHPHQIQGDMQFECQLLVHGLDPGIPNNYRGAAAEQLMAGASDWCLLLQVASDDKSGMMWGDSGNLYVWIHRSDLRARRFERSRVILQCY